MERKRLEVASRAFQPRQQSPKLLEGRFRVLGEDTVLLNTKHKVADERISNCGVSLAVGEW